MTHNACSGQICSGWRDERCPIINGIFWHNDSLILLDVANASAGRNVTVTPLGRTDLTSLERKKPLSWTSLIQLCEVRSSTDLLIARGGEGGFGGDGFVGLFDADDTLIWLAFFDCSNPFYSISINKETVNATSNRQLIWKFPIATPEQIAVVAG